MADDFNYEEFARRFNDTFTQSIRDASNSAFRRTADDIVSIAKKASDKEAADRKQRQQKQYADMKRSTDSVLQFSRSLQNSATSLDTLQQVVNLTAKSAGGLLSIIPGVGGALKGLAEAAGNGVNLIMDVLNRFYSEYEKLSATGVVTTTTDFKKAMAATGLTMSDLTKVLGKYSKELSYFGGSAIEGRIRFEEISEQTQELRDNFQRLGINSSDFSEYQLNYLNLLRRTGRQEKDLRAGTSNYILQLDALSKLTGQSKEALQNELNERMRDVRFRAGIASLAKDNQAAFNNINSLISVFQGTGAGNIARGLQDIIGGLAPNSPAAQSIYNLTQLGGLDVENLKEKLRSGQTTAIEAFNEIQVALKRANPQLEELARGLGDANDITKLYAESIDVANKAQLTPELLNKILSGQKEAIKGQDEENKNLADTRRNMYKLQIAVEKLFTSMGWATGVMRYFTDAMQKAMTAVSGVLGDRSRKGLEQFNKDIGVRALAQPAAQAAGSASVGGPGTGTVTSQSSAQLSVDNKVNPFAGIQMKSGAYNQSTEIHPDLIDIAKKISGIPGFNQITSVDDQIADRAAGSRHYKGQALDFTINDPKNADSVYEKLQNISKGLILNYYDPAVRAKYPHTGSGHFHVEIPKMAKGGRVEDPTVAMVGENGAEAVVPLPDNRNIPVTFNSDLLKSLNQKLESLIALTEKSNSIQSDFYRQLV